MRNQSAGINRHSGESILSPENFYNTKTEEISITGDDYPEELTNKYNSLMHDISDVVFILDKDRDFVELLQPRKGDITLHPEIWVGKNILDTGLPSNSLSLLKKALDTAEKSGLPEYIEYSFSTSFGLQWYNACIEKKITADGKFDGFIIITKNITEKKVIESALKESEEKYKLLADNITDLVAIYAPDGKVEFVSASIWELLGYDPETLTGTDPSQFIHPDDLKWMTENFNPEDYYGDDFFSAEYRLRHADGHWVYFSTRRKPIRNEQGQIQQILCNCRDITDKIKYEEALKNSDAHYKLLADNILDLVALHDLNGIFEYVSPSSLSVLGYKPEELLGINAFELIHPLESRELWNKNFNKALEGCDQFIDEFRMLHKNGNWIYLETTTKIIRGKDGNPEKFLTTSRDISEWKLAKFALIESEEKYRSLIETSDASIAVMDKNGKFLFVNDIRMKFFNMRKEEIIGKSMFDFYSKEQADEFMEQFNIAIRENKKLIAERVIERCGHEYWLRTTISPIKDSYGKVCAAMLSSIDISNLKESEKKLRQQNRELKNIAFLQSHIVRSPLANLKALLGIMDTGSLTEENKKIFEMMVYSAEQLDNIIKGIVEKAITAEKNMTAED